MSGGAEGWESAMASVIQKYVQAFKTFGWRETLIKMYTVRAKRISIL